MIRPPAATSSTTPAWPIASSSRVVTNDLGNCRPLAACKSGRGSRHHAGEDLPAPAGTPIVAVDDGEVVRILVGWFRGTDALLLQTDGGPVVNYGEIAADSPASFGVTVGSRVTRGQTIGRVGPFDHLHFETYASGTRTTHQWPLGTAAPAALRDPIPYLVAAGGTTSGKPSTPAQDGGGAGALFVPVLAVLAAYALL